MRSTFLSPNMPIFCNFSMFVHCSSIVVSCHFRFQVSFHVKLSRNLSLFLGMLIFFHVLLVLQSLFNFFSDFLVDFSCKGLGNEKSTYDEYSKNLQNRKAKQKTKFFRRPCFSKNRLLFTSGRILRVGSRLLGDAKKMPLRITYVKRCNLKSYYRAIQINMKRNFSPRKS